MEYEEKVAVPKNEDFTSSPATITTTTYTMTSIMPTSRQMSEEEKLKRGRLYSRKYRMRKRRHQLATSDPEQMAQERSAKLRASAREASRRYRLRKKLALSEAALATVLATAAAMPTTGLINEEEEELKRRRVYTWKRSKQVKGYTVCENKVRAPLAWNLSRVAVTKTKDELGSIPAPTDHDYAAVVKTEEEEKEEDPDAEPIEYIFQNLVDPVPVTEALPVAVAWDFNNEIKAEPVEDSVPVAAAWNIDGEVKTESVLEPLPAPVEGNIDTQVKAEEELDLVEGSTSDSSSVECTPAFDDDNFATNRKRSTREKKLFDSRVRSWNYRQRRKEQEDFLRTLKGLPSRQRSVRPPPSWASHYNQ